MCMCAERGPGGSDPLQLTFSEGPCGCRVQAVRAGRVAESRGSRPWPGSAPDSASPVQTEVREPVLDDNHHVADREEEGRDLERLRGAGTHNRVEGPLRPDWGP